ncbi:hypothetical protein [Roseibium sp.]|uniref:hypothetical protein n=1 Tax=Roseibium sp. TaxID=1936156 RepID=UPI003B51C527
MHRTTTIQFLDKDGEVLETAVYVCDWMAAHAAAADHAEEIGADDWEPVNPLLDDTEEFLEAAE